MGFQMILEVKVLQKNNLAALKQKQPCMEEKTNFQSNPDKCFFSKLFRSFLPVAFLFVKSYPINNQNFSQENSLEGCLFKSQVVLFICSSRFSQKTNAFYFIILDRSSL